jgi:hypothetical protein
MPIIHFVGTGQDEQITGCFSGGSTMTRQLFFTIAAVGAAMLFHSAAEATSFRCEDRAANCVGRCANFTGGAGDFRGHQNKCMVSCDRQVTACLIRADERWHREYPGVR